MLAILAAIVFGFALLLDLLDTDFGAPDLFNWNTLVLIGLLLLSLYLAGVGSGPRGGGGGGGGRWYRGRRPGPWLTGTDHRWRARGAIPASWARPGTVFVMESDALFSLGEPAGSRSAPDGPAGVDGFTAVADDSPLPVRMRPVTLDELVGQDHLLAPGAPLRQLVSGGGPDVGDPLGPAGQRQDHHRAPGGRGHRPPLRRHVGALRRRQGRPGGDRGGAPPAPLRRPADRALHRRGAPVQQDPAGFAARRRRGPHCHAAGGDHREPVLLGHLAAAVAVRAAHPATARRRGGAGPAAPRGRRQARPGRRTDPDHRGRGPPGPARRR